MKKKKRLFLDDVRYVDQVYQFFPQDEWKIVRNIEEFKKAIQEEFPDFISFDHDLSLEQMEYYINQHQFTDVPIDYNKAPFNDGNTGLDCTKWLISYCKTNNLELPQYACHSANHIGKQNILSLLKDTALSED